MGGRRGVLVVGLGSGVTLGSVLTHPVKEVECVELEDAVVQASRFFDDVSGSPLRDPRVRLVVALGRIGHEAWLRAAGWWSLPARQRPRFAHGAETRLPDGTILMCSYHPSRQNTNTGRLDRAMWHDVFRRARALLGPP